VGRIYLGDIRYYFLNDVGGALDAWQSAFEKVDWNTAREWTTQRGIFLNDCTW